MGNSGTLEMFNFYIFIKMHKLKMLFIPVLLSLLLIPFSTSFAQEEDIPYEEDLTYEEYDATTYDYDTEVDELISPYVTETPTGLTAGLAAVSIGIWIVSMTIGLAAYIFMAYALSKIGKEMGYKNSWFAWIPILQAIMLFQLGNVSPWLLLVPIVNSIFMIIAFMNLTQRRGYDKILGLIVLTGIGTYILLYLLAWQPKTGDSIVQESTPSIEPTQPEQPPVE